MDTGNTDSDKDEVQDTDLETPEHLATLQEVDAGRKLFQAGFQAGGPSTRAPPSRLTPELKLSQIAPAISSVPKRNMLSSTSRTRSSTSTPLTMDENEKSTQDSRRLLWQAEKLDGFRRGWDRGSCAHESSRDWRPPQAFVNSTKFGDSHDVSDLSSDTVTWMAVRDLQSWRDYAWPIEEVDIIAWGAGQVNKPGQV